MDIHPGALIGKRPRIDRHGDLFIGATAIIGNDVAIGYGVRIGSNAPGLWPAPPGPVIGDRVVIGNGARIATAVRVGHDAIIGEHAIVVADVLPNSRVAAGPAHDEPPHEPLRESGPFIAYLRW